jgi:hypothetical protein
MKSRALIDAIAGITKKWTKQRKREERERSAALNRRYFLVRRQFVSIKEAAWQVMEEAFMRAAGNDKLPANARQIMYAARRKVAQLADRELGGTFDKYFTQTLIPDYVAQVRPPWASRVVFDARGHFTEPHTKIEIGLGTLEVRNYLAKARSHQVNGIDFNICEKHYPSSGPKNRFGAVLYCEKEGFDLLFEETRLAERFDLAIMSNKGMSVTASRELVQELCATYGIKLFVLHDFDISGFSIFGTISGNTRRFTYHRTFEVVDLGLRIGDIGGLERERVYVSSPDKVAATLRRHGATQEEIDILVGGERVELNALASDQLIELIERKLTEHGVRKVIPDDATLADAYRRMRRQIVVQEKIDKLIDELGETEVEIPAGLRQRIETAIEENPERPWDALMRDIAEQDHEVEWRQK